MKRRGRGRATKLDFVNEIHVGSRKGWTLDKAYIMADYLKQHMIADFQAIAKLVGISRSSCQFMLKEFKAASAAGLTLEQYFAKGRPYRYGKKVLA